MPSTTNGRGRPLADAFVRAKPANFPGVFPKSPVFAQINATARIMEQYQRSRVLDLSQRLAVIQAPTFKKMLETAAASQAPTFKKMLEPALNMALEPTFKKMLAAIAAPQTAAIKAMIEAATASQTAAIKTMLEAAAASQTDAMRRVLDTSQFDLWWTSPQFTATFENLTKALDLRVKIDERVFSNGHRGPSSRISLSGSTHHCQRTRLRHRPSRL